MKKINQETKIFDTTLRDGEQMPGVVFTPNQKIELAHKFDDFGVDFIDLMPVVSENEMEIAKILSNAGLNAEISALTRCLKKDIDIALDCGVSRVLLFTSLSDIQREVKLGTSREENLRSAQEMIEYAKEHGLKVDFGGEDTTRLYLEDPSYLIEFINELGDIDYFFAADTISCLFPHETYEFVKYLKDNCKCKIGLHGHNDIGMATANVLEGLRGGADLFSGTFTGIGERAGNAAIEEVCVALKTKGIDLDVKCYMLTEICGLVEKYSGVKLQKHKPIVGENAFTHESGIHVNAIIKDPKTYETIDPEVIGQKRRLLFGKHSGKAGLKHILKEYVLSNSKLDSFLSNVKSLAELNGSSLSESQIVELYKEQLKPQDVYA